MSEITGKTCPYCKTPFTDSDDIVVCSECDMPHHKDCWVENSGCTTFGCQGTIKAADAPPKQAEPATGGAPVTAEGVSETAVVESAAADDASVQTGKSEEMHPECAGDTGTPIAQSQPVQPAAAQASVPAPASAPQSYGGYAPPQAYPQQAANAAAPLQYSSPAPPPQTAYMGNVPPVPPPARGYQGYAQPYQGYAPPAPQPQQYRNNVPLAPSAGGFYTPPVPPAGAYQGYAPPPYQPYPGASAHVPPPPYQGYAPQGGYQRQPAPGYQGNVQPPKTPAAPSAPAGFQGPPQPPAAAYKATPPPQNGALQPLNTAGSQQIIYCTNCGMACFRGDTFCRRCGRPLG